MWLLNSRFKVLGSWCCTFMLLGSVQMSIQEEVEPTNQDVLKAILAISEDIQTLQTQITNLEESVGEAMSSSASECCKCNAQGTDLSQGIEVIVTDSSTLCMDENEINTSDIKCTHCAVEDGYFQVGTQCFFLPFGQINETTWDDAQAICQEQHGILAEPRSIPDFQKALLRKSFGELFWLGATDRIQEGVWTWSSDGVKIGNFESWEPGQPNNYGGDEDCLYIYSTKKQPLHDVTCEANYLFVCERK